MQFKKWRGGVVMAISACTAIVMQPRPASAQSPANREAENSEHSAYSVVYSFRGEEDGSKPAQLVRLGDGTILGSSAGGNGTIFQLVGDKVKTLHQFDVSNNMTMYPWHGGVAILKAKPRLGSRKGDPFNFFRFSVAEGLQAMPEECEDFLCVAPGTRPNIIYGIGPASGIFRFDQSNRDLQLAQKYMIRDVREGGDGYIYAITGGTPLSSRERIVNPQLVRWTEDLRQDNVLHTFERPWYAEGEIVLPGDQKVYGVMAGGRTGGVRGFVYEIGCDGSGYRQILETTGRILSVEDGKAYVLTNWSLEEPDHPTRHLLYVVDLETGESREILRDLWAPGVKNYEIAFMANHALWGIEPHGGEIRKGAIFRIWLP